MNYLLIIPEDSKLNKIKRVSALCAACVLGLACVSCGNKEEKRSGVIVDTNIPANYSVAEKDMPYGSTLVELKPSSDEKIKIATEFDRRFLSNEEAYVISEYLWALSVKDESSVKNTFYPELLDYTVEIAGMDNAAAYIEASYDNLKDALGGDFEFTYLDITAVETPDDSPETFEEMDIGLKDCSSDDILSKVTSRKLVTLEGLTMYRLPDGTEKLVSGALPAPISLCIYEIDGRYYIV